MAVAHHDVERARLVAGEKVVVVGGGPVGVLVAVVAAARGAQVLVIEPDAYRRGIIEGLGFAVADPADDVAAAVAVHTAGAGADVSFEVSGSQPGLTTAVDALRPRGRLVAIGIHTEPRLVDLKRVFWKELEILGARVYDRSDYEGAIALVAAHKIPADALITHVTPLSSAPEAFDLLGAGGTVMKVLVDCREGGVR